MGVTYLLDTHVFLWLLGEPQRMPSDVLEDLASHSNRLLVSAASAMEVATKVRLGRLDQAGVVVDSWSARVADLRAEPAVDDGARPDGRVLAVGAP